MQSVDIHIDTCHIPHLGSPAGLLRSHYNSCWYVYWIHSLHQTPDTPSAMVLIDFLRRRATFAKHLESCSTLSTSHYFRLMLLALLEMILATAATATSLWTATLDIRPWTSWADVHWGFSRIGQYPAAALTSTVAHYYCALWWFVPASSAVFFLFFAFGRDTMREYGALGQWVRTRLFRLRVQEPHNPVTSSIPSFGYDPFTF